MKEGFEWLNERETVEKEARGGQRRREEERCRKENGREEVLCWVESGGAGKKTRKGKKEREFWAEEKEERGREKAVGTAKHAAHLLDSTRAELAGARAVFGGHTVRFAGRGILWKRARVAWTGTG